MVYATRSTVYHRELIIQHLLLRNHNGKEYKNKKYTYMCTIGHFAVKQR